MNVELSKQNKELHSSRAGTNGDDMTSRVNPGTGRPAVYSTMLSLGEPSVSMLLLILGWSF